MNPQLLAPYTNYLKQAKLCLVVLPANPTFDQQLAASSLMLALKQHEKKTDLVGVKKIINPTIAGLDQLKDQVGSNNLVISFDYNPRAVDNVGYHLDEESNRFYLTIKPKKGSQPLDKNTVEMDYAGVDADLIVLFGVSDLESLEHLYYGYEDLYSSASLISIGSSRPLFQSNFIDTSQSTSSCEAVYHLLNEAGLKPSDESATNLLAGIQYQTNNFIDPSADANTFEAIANLLRMGARRKSRAFVDGEGDGKQTQPRVSKTAEDAQKNWTEDSLRGDFKNGDSLSANKNVYSSEEKKSEDSDAGKDELDEVNQKAAPKAAPIRPSGLLK